MLTAGGVFVAWVRAHRAPSNVPGSPFPAVAWGLSHSHNYRDGKMFVTPGGGVGAGERGQSNS